MINSMKKSKLIGAGIIGILIVITSSLIYIYWLRENTVLYVAVQTDKGEAKILKKNVERWKNTASFDLPPSFEKMDSHQFRLQAVDDSRGLLYMSVKGQGIKVLDLETENIVKNISINGNIRRLVLSPDGKRIFVDNTLNSENRTSDRPLTIVFNSVNGEIIDKIDFPVGSASERLNKTGTKIYNAWCKGKNEAGKFIYDVEADTYSYIYLGKQKVKKNGGLRIKNKYKTDNFIYVDKSGTRKAVLKVFDRDTLKLLNELDISAQYKNFGSVETSYPTMFYNDHKKLLLPITLMEEHKIRKRVLPQRYLAIIDLEKFKIESTHRIPDTWRGYVLTEE